MISIFDKEWQLENERVVLRPLQQSDFTHLLPFSLQEPEIWKYGVISAAGASHLDIYIQKALAAREAQKEYPFIVYDKINATYAGSTRFYDIQEGCRTTQLGYTWYGKQFQRTGLNRACKWLMLQFCFETWNLERVEFRADADNAASIAAMQAIGCTVEGILRSHTLNLQGGRRNTIILSILREEWFNGVAENLKKKIN